jgi:adenine-specific DNA methylase
MLRRIEVDFPVELVNPLAEREANAKRPYQLLHKWWARRLGCVFRTIILSSLIPDPEWKQLDEIARKQGITAWHWLYYRQCHVNENASDHTGHGCAEELIAKYCKDKIILDPFMGGGTTVVEALRLGCKVIGLDVNPVAWFITKKSVEPVNLNKLQEAFKRLERTVAPEILRWYRTQCPKGHEADVMYVFWVKTVECSSCGKKTRLFNSFRIATKKGEDTVKDAVVCPACYTVQWVDKGSNEVTCFECKTKFNKEGFVSDGDFRCEHCGHKDKTVDWVRRTGRAPGYEMFAIEYWCQQCYEKTYRRTRSKRRAQAEARGYKGAEEFDRNLYLQACEEFERRKAELPLPPEDLELPDGYNTQQAIKQGLRRWQDLFNPRQLLCLGMLMKAILQIEDKAVRELMAVTLADCVNCNNMLCEYNARRTEIEPLFGHHAYWPKNMPVENNVWGTELGRGSWKSYAEKTLKCVKWLLKPTEPIETDEDSDEERKKVDLADSPLTPTNQDANSVLNGSFRCALYARTAEDLSFLPDKSIDAIITDPPYYGNVMYGELSDFFYVWLRLALKDDYPEFSPPLVNKEREIVVNEKAVVGTGDTGQGTRVKDDTFFREGLLRCFRECHRVLKDDGLLVFTFHHEKPKAWAAVLDAVLQAGFDIKRVWTYHSETRSGVHGEGIRFDTVIVARKRVGEPMEASWASLQDEIVSEVQAELKRLLENGVNVSPEDVFVIVMGKALAVYSRHYPKVMREGKQVSLEDAIEDIEAIVDEQIDAYYGMVVPPWLDSASRIYCQTLAHRPAVTRDALVKVCRTRGIDFSVFVERQFIKQEKGGIFKVLKPSERKGYLEGFWGGKAKARSGVEPLPIDRAHWLHIAWESGRPVDEVAREIYRSGLEEVCDALAKITRDQTYSKIAERLRRMKEQGKLIG